MRPHERPRRSSSVSSNRTYARVKPTIAHRPSSSAPETFALLPSTAELNAPVLNRRTSQDSLSRPYTWKVDQVTRRSQAKPRSIKRKSTTRQARRAKPEPRLIVRAPAGKPKVDPKPTVVRFLLPGPLSAEVPGIVISACENSEERERQERSVYKPLREFLCVRRARLQMLEQELQIGMGRERRDSLEGLPQITCKRAVKPALLGQRLLMWTREHCSHAILSSRRGSAKSDDASEGLRSTKSVGVQTG
ncbi:hypothetical protein B0A55_06912 [Friedmanniomyces simplex]|uniref:Uncharacterized protein n=1 Tax=Friedmanniomyces simplex TaxID=329884 RepID=A0A4U0X8C7_9PEZI|nr:hypothetical protein B0A55_06912 [Friedmanniomyces simplex]